MMLGQLLGLIEPVAAWARLRATDFKLIAMASYHLLPNSDALQPKSDGLQAHIVFFVSTFWQL